MVSEVQTILADILAEQSQHHRTLHGYHNRRHKLDPVIALWRLTRDEAPFSLGLAES